MRNRILELINDLESVILNERRNLCNTQSTHSECVIDCYGYVRSQLEYILDQCDFESSVVEL